MCLFVPFLFVGLLRYLKNDMSKFHQIFSTCYLWLYLCLFLMAMQYVRYFGFVDDVVLSYFGLNQGR